MISRYRWPLVLIASALLAAPSGLVAQQRPRAAEATRQLQPSQMVTLDENAASTTHLVLDDLRVSVRRLTGSDGEPTALAVVQASGTSPVHFDLPAASLGFALSVGAGPFGTSGDRMIYFEAYTFGAHCCTIKTLLIVPVSGPIVKYDLGPWDGEPSDVFPRDYDGDGVIDFVVTDERFLYSFASYAGSYAPPVIVNLVDGRFRNVSRRQSFRPLFQDAARVSRELCRASDEDAERNGGCAAFVASAAVLGRFDEAWAEMLLSFQPVGPEWLPTSCSDRLAGEQECPAAQIVRYRDFPEALTSKLGEWGYLGSRQFTHPGQVSTRPGN